MRNIILNIAVMMTVLLFLSCEKIRLSDEAAQSSTTPSTNDTCYVWEGHVVVWENRHDASKELMLISLYEWSGMPSANHVTDSILVRLVSEGYQEMNIAEWHIPTTEESKHLRAVYGYGGHAFEALNNNLVLVDASPVSGTDRYLCEQGCKSFSLASGTSISNAGSKARTYKLRLLRHVQLP